MSVLHRFMAAGAFLVAAAGFMLGLWPLEAAGVLSMAFVGKGWLAVPLGFLLDIAYGSPVGALHYLFFPFTILALVVIILRFWGNKYFLDKTSQDTL